MGRILHGCRVMHRFLALVSRFGRDERGVFAVIFGLMAIVLVALGGAAVDYVSLEQTRSRAQIALDAAALALQPEIFKEPLNVADITTKAQNLLNDRLGTAFNAVADINEGDVAVNVEEGSLYLVADLNMPTIFVSLVGVPSMRARIQSEATRKVLALEVAFVLDNSGSMSYTGAGSSGTRQRMQFLKDAATCATNILFYKDVVDKPGNADTCIPAPGAEVLEDVRIGVVPFTMYVNIGPTNANATWIDKTGNSAAANDNFDNDDNDATPFNSAVDRLALYDQITNDDWRGCVEARPHVSSGGATQYLDTDDTPATTGQPNTYFVPLFAPDLPDSMASFSSGYNNYVGDHPAACKVTGTCTWTETRSKCSSYNNCSGSTNNNYTLTGRDKGSLSCSCPTSSSSWTSDTGTGNYTGSGSNRTYTRVRVCSFQYDAQNLSSRELQERMCKYNGAMSVTNNQKGPNVDCPFQPVLPLSNSPTTINNTITAMVASGGTNIHEGSAWGFRALSPTAPFAEGEAYSDDTSKIMIVMTDGENTAYQTNNINGSHYFSAYGFPYNSSSSNVTRLGSISSTNAQIVQEMNTRTRQTCENAKAAGITIYTIGLATSSASQSTQAEVEDMLADCASTRDKAYFPQNPGELKTVFQDIANDLTQLRLAR